MLSYKRVNKIDTTESTKPKITFRARIRKSRQRKEGMSTSVVSKTVVAFISRLAGVMDIDSYNRGSPLTAEQKVRTRHLIRTSGAIWASKKVVK